MDSKTKTAILTGNGPFIIYSPALALKIGSNGALVVGFLSARELRPDSARGTLKKEIPEGTGLTSSTVERVLANLKEANLIESERVDYRNYWRLNWDAIAAATKG